MTIFNKTENYERYLIKMEFTQNKYLKREEKLK